MLDPRLTEPQLSNRLLQPLLARIGEQHDADTLQRILTDAGLPEDYIRDPEKRVSVLYMNRFREAVGAHLLSLPPEACQPPMDAEFWQLWREAGQRSFEREMIGSIWPVIRAMGSPRPIYQRLANLMEEANPGTVVSVLKNSGGVAVLSFACTEGWEGEGPEVCWSRRGALEGVPSIWGLPLAKVEHLECMHDPRQPAAACLYRIHYRQRSVVELGVPVLVGLIGARLAWWASPEPLMFLLGGMAGLGAEGWRRWWRDRRAYRRDSALLSQVAADVREQYRQLWDEREQLRRTLLEKQRISPYLPLDLLQLLDERAEAPTLGGESREITVLFCDIASYSTLSEHLPPDEVLTLLNAFFTEMEEVIGDGQGAVLSYLGDGLMAAFGAPRDLPDHPEQAVRCALAMQARLEELNERWRASGAMARWGLSGISARWGVHTGHVVAGNLGSQRRMAYSIIGDAVNVAARLEALNKTLGTLILISGATWARLPVGLQVALPGLGVHTVKGRKQTVTVYGR